MDRESPFGEIRRARDAHLKLKYCEVSQILDIKMFPHSFSTKIRNYKELSLHMFISYNYVGVIDQLCPAINVSGRLASYSLNNLFDT